MHYQEKVSIKRVRELRIKIPNESRRVFVDKIKINGQLKYPFAKTLADNAEHK
jgi:hypothetical protein